MVGDKLIIKDIHRKKAKKAIEKFYLSDHCTIRKVIAIAGESGTGKSEVSHLMRQYFSKSQVSSAIVSLDDYYKVRPVGRKLVREWEGIKSVGYHEINWKELDFMIDDFKNNKVLFFREYDKFSEQYRNILFEYVPKILIVEGLYALYSYFDFGVYLGGTYKETKGFRIDRGKEDQTNFRKKVLEKEQADVQKSKCHADIILDMEGNVKDNY